MDDLKKLFDDLVNFDPHFRQNAVRFLSEKYIKEHSTMNEENKKKIIDGLLSKLNDKEDSLEVKGVTVREFGRMAHLLKENETVQIFGMIITFITSDKAIGRDIYVSCIKEILKKSQGSSCYIIGQTIIPELTKGIMNSLTVIKELCFDTFNDYLITFNYVLIKENDSLIKNKEVIFKAALEAIQIDSPTMRKICCNFLGSIALILKKDQLNVLMNMILKFINSTKDLKLKISYFNTLSAIAKSSANKQAEYVDKILPVLYEYISISYLQSYNSTEEYDLKNELVEASLSIVEIYVLKLTYIMKPRAEEVINCLLKLIDYDPNYDYNQEEAAYNEEYDYDYDYNAYTNDDSSWKVRRSTVKTIQSFVKSRMDIDKSLTTHVISKLVDCIKEREENTKLEIVGCISSFLRTFTVENDLGFSKKVSYVKSIDEVLQSLLEKLSSELNNNSKSNVNSAILQAFTSLALVDSILVVQSLPSLNKNLLKLFKESNDYALSILHLIGKALKNIQYGSDILGEIPTILEWIKIGIKHDYYKVVIEAIKLSSLFAKMVSNSAEMSKQVVNEIYELILPKLKLNDTDQELKLSVITASGNLLLYLGIYLNKDQIKCILTLFYDKQNNDNLIISVFSWLIRIIKENKSLDLEAEMGKYVELLLKIIVKYNLKFQFQALEFLKNISIAFPQALKNYVEGIDNVLIQSTKEESLVEIIYDILINLYSNFEIKPELINKSIIHAIKLLEGSNHSMPKNVYKFLANLTEKISNKDLKAILLSELRFDSLNYNKAKCIGILSKVTQSEQSGIEKCVSAIKETYKTDPLITKNALICLGEIALRSSTSNVEAFKFVENQLTILPDDFKHDVSSCLGKVAVNNFKLFISNISKAAPTVLGFYLIAIREALLEIESNSLSVESLQLNTLFEILIMQTKNEDEKVRQLTGECLGYAALISEDLLSLFFANLSSNSDDVKGTFLFGLKFIFSSKKYSSVKLETAIQSLFESMSSTSLKSRQAAYSSLPSFVFNYYDYICTKSGIYTQLWNLVIAYSNIDSSLIDQVDLGGGIKIKNDKGLVIRKAIYLSVKILLEHIPEKLNIFSTLEVLLKGLSDTEDIQSISTACLIKISLFAPDAFISIIETVVDVLVGRLKALSTPANQDAKVDQKKIFYFCEEIYRLLKELNKIGEIEENAKFTHLFIEVEKNVELAKSEANNISK